MADLTDAELAALEARYTPTIVPPCRVCGGDMGIGKIGGGEPTVWVCNHAFDNGRGKDAWDHYGKSEFVDRRRGGDHEVIALLAEVRALRAEVAALRECAGEAEEVLAPFMLMCSAWDGQHPQTVVAEVGVQSIRVSAFREARDFWLGRLKCELDRAALAGVRAGEPKA